MTHDAPFVVKRIAPPIGRPDERRRIAVHHGAYTLADALENARNVARRRATLKELAAKGGGPAPLWLALKIRELERTATWIERRDATATITTKRGRQGGGG